MLLWSDVLRQLRADPSDPVIYVQKEAIAHPLTAGAHVSIGLPKGQLSDFRWKLDDCTGLHVQEFQTHFRAHLDSVAPECDLPGHLIHDAPIAWLAGWSLFGAFAGGLLSGASVGAFVGGALGALGAVALRPKRSA